MDYQKVMAILSQCGLGALLLSERGEILEANELGVHLLHGEGGLTGKRLDGIAPELCEESEDPLYANIAFGEYLLRVPSPELEVPPGTQLIVFRNAADDACHDMLISVMNQLKESVALYDAKGRAYLLNDATVQMEAVSTPDVVGEYVSDIYRVRDGSELATTQVLRTKKPLIDKRIYYSTRFGRDVDTMTSTYPITQNGQLLGAFCIMEDWHMMDDLHRQILELQSKLLNKPATGKQNDSNLSARYHFQDIRYTSAAMGRVVEQCRQVAKSDSSVMIYGETGTGKELFAQSIHNASRRADGPFLAINCAAIPENLLEGLLFGTERGAYTGAERREGLFEQADGGTLLLDELNSMNINLQSKLLRVLQDGAFRRVGGTTELRTNVRVLSNINMPPYRAIEENKLRRDLFYRLGVVNISIPPLRERKEDIPMLVKSFIIRYNKSLEKNVKDISPETLSRFQRYDWPGNVRELQHAIEHAMNILPDTLSRITPEFLPEQILLAARAQAEEATPPSLNRAVKDMEYQAVCRALRESGGNISAAAKTLNMSRQNLQYRIKRYQIDLAKLKK